jgi:hypothetical protein
MSTLLFSAHLQRVSGTSLMALIDKQQRFVAEYLAGLNTTQAAIRTGYAALCRGDHSAWMRY